MFNVGGGEVLVILVLALVVLGPDKLPSAARAFGKHLGDFRRISGGFRAEIANAMNLESSAPASTTEPAPVGTSAPTPPATPVLTSDAALDPAPEPTSGSSREATVEGLDPDELVAVRSDGPVESFV
jgi:sec-independent protein translocase protein TatB